jgi:hypothetical protein
MRHLPDSSVVSLERTPTLSVFGHASWHSWAAAHTFATAYNLGRLGVNNVAVLEQGYVGSGSAGRNTTILRSTYKAPEGVRFYDPSIKPMKACQPSSTPTPSPELEAAAVSR